jgi:Na+-translocating ferredoxin:NAD+ oxidoreductase RnfG subunit
MPPLAFGQEGVFLKEEEAPRAVFPQASAFDRKVIRSTDELKEKIRQRMGKTKTSLWEDAYVTFVAKNGEAILGYAVVVEEIGKHRPITFVVGVGTDGKIKDVALMVYREAYGGEVRDRRFLQQYKGKELKDSLLPYRDIQNISGATLSVEAVGRASKKALALIDAVYLEGKEPR